MARLRLENAWLWLLDEPANGLDESNRSLLCALIETHVAAGGACLFASHDRLPFRGAVSELDLDAA